MFNPLDLLFPKICVGCGGEGAWCCDACFAGLQITMFEGGFDEPASGDLSGVYVPFSYETVAVREAIQLLKYQGVWDLALPLGRLLADYLSQFVLGDLVCLPVPLHKKRQVDRGFNQAGLLADQLPYGRIDRSVVRARASPPQATLSALERQQNVVGVYRVLQAEDLVGRDVLLVDDVITTGSTVQEIARLAKTAGARRVWAAAVARG